MRKTNLTFYFIIFAFQINLYGQKTIASDSVLYHYTSGKDSVRVITKNGKTQRISYYENGNIEHISLRGRWMYRGSRAYYPDGKAQYRSKSWIILRRTKEWDKQGRIIKKTRTLPAFSTSHTTKSKKNYRDSITGQKNKIEKTKYNIACFGGRGYTKDILITFDANGKRISRENLLPKQKIDYKKSAGSKSRRMKVVF